MLLQFLYVILNVHVHDGKSHAYFFTAFWTWNKKVYTLELEHLQSCGLEFGKGELELKNGNDLMASNTILQTKTSSGILHVIIGHLVTCLAI